MRALISSSTFPLELDDGLPRFVFDLAKHLSERCDVIALAPGAPGASPQERLGGIEVRRFTYFRPRRLQSLAYGHGMRQNIRSSIFNKIQVLPFIWNQTVATRRLVRQNRPDVVNSHWMIPQGLSTALAARRSPPFRHVLTVHAADVYALQQSLLGPRMARFIISKSDFVFATGSRVRDSLDALLGTPSEARLQPMGVHVSLFRDAPRAELQPSFSDGYLLFFGRLVEKKGVEFLLRAMPRILERYPCLGLVIVGYGPEERALRKQASRSGIESSVRFMGRCSHPDIAGYLSGAELTVVPSIVDRNGETEGMPTVVLEAMAAGRPVVGCAVDGIPDIIRDGENGWLCREKDPIDLAAKILAALDDRPSIADMGRRATETAEGFDWKKVSQTYLDAFRGRLWSSRDESHC